MMALADVLTRLVIIYLRGRRLAGGHRAVPGRHPCLIWHRRSLRATLGP